MDKIHKYIQRYFDNFPRWTLLPLQKKTKRPLVTEWTTLTRADSEKLMAEYTEKEINIGLKTGVGSGVVVLDFDGAIGQKTYEDLFKEIRTATVKTGNGLHLYFKISEDLQLSNMVRVLPGVDLRANGGQIMLPPSVHPSGAIYQWLIPPTEMDTIPDWVLGKLKPTTIYLPQDEKERILWDGVEQGGRNDAATRIAGRLFRKGLTESEVRFQLVNWNKRNKPPLSEQEINNIIKSIYKSELSGLVKDDIFLSSAHTDFFLKELKEKIQNTSINIPYGFKDIDIHTYGLQKKEVVIIASRTNVGKSALAIKIAAHNVKLGKKVLYFSTECSNYSILSRYFAMTYNIPAIKFRNGEVTLEDIKPYVDDFKTVSFIVNDKPSPTLRDIENMITKFSPDIVFIDYIQELCFEEYGLRYLLLQKAMASLRQFAKLYDVAIVATAQVSRQPKTIVLNPGEEAHDYRPTLSDLRESGALEQASDLVFLLSKIPQTITEQGYDVRCELAKARDLPTKNFILHFNAPFVRFEDSQNG